MFSMPPVPPVRATSCLQQSLNSIVIDPLQPALHHQGVPRIENGRLTVTAPASTVQLTNPTELTLTLDGQGARCVHTVQCHQDVRTGQCMSRIPETVQIVPVLSRRDGSHYITFTPLLTGHTGLIVTAEFSDGVFAEQSTYLNVEYPVQIPQKLTISLSGSSSLVSDKVSLSLKEAGRVPRRLMSSVYYEGHLEKFSVEPEKVRFTLKTAGPGEVVDFEPGTGTITPVALGHVLITAEFSGATTHTCVVVVDDTVGSIAPINCDDLLRP